MSSPPLSLESQPTSRQLILQVGVATLGRFALNTSRRFIYPFAPALSRGLDVPLTSITSLIAVNQATGLLSPLFGPLSDRWGYRIMLLIGLSMLAVGMFASGLLPLYGVILVSLFLAGLGKSIFDPTLQAYIGERVSYKHRGLAIGVTEFGWSGSSLIGIPVAGFLIDRLGWRSPFLILAGLALLCIALLAILLPPASGRRQQQGGERATFSKMWQLLKSNPLALAGLAFAFWLSVGNDSLFVVLGLWLESFGLSLTAVGVAASVIGLAELAGEALTASLGDRVGLNRALMGGLILTMVGYLLLPFSGISLPLALIGLFGLFLFFEFSVVTSISLFTEVMPETRATMMSALFAAFSIGRVVGALLGGVVWNWGGLVAVGTISALTTALGLACLGWGLRTRPKQ